MKNKITKQIKKEAKQNDKKNPEVHKKISNIFYLLW